MPAEHVQMTCKARLLLMAVALVLLAPSAVIPLRNPMLLSIQHGREVAQPPQMDALLAHPTRFFRDLEQWHKDYVGFGIRAARLYRQAEFFLLGDIGAPNIERGPDRMLFLASHRADKSLSSIANSCPAPADWSRISDSITEDWQVVTSMFRAYKIEPILLIYPSKKVLYPEALPNTVPFHLRQRCMKMRDLGNPIVALAEAFPHSVIDAYPDLVSHKNRAHFYPPENFHADGESAVRATHAVMNAWNWPIKSIDEIAFQRQSTHSDLSFSLGFVLPSYSLEPAEFQKPSIVPDPAFLERTRAFLGAHVYANQFLNPEAIMDEDVLLIANSFGARTAPYISEYAKTVRVVETNQLRQVDKLHRLFHDYVFADAPDRVLFVLHEESVFEDRLGKYVAGLRKADGASAD